MFECKKSHFMFPGVFIKRLISNLFIIGFIFFLISPQQLSAGSKPLSRPHSGNITDKGAHHFMENKGQLKTDKGESASEVLFYGRLQDANVYFTRHAIVYDFITWDSPSDQSFENKNLPPAINSDTKPLRSGKSYRVDMEFLNANPTVSVKGTSQSEGYNNYYLGNDEKQWKLGVKSFSELKYENIYPGIDLIIHAKENGEGIKYDLIVNPGADPSVIQYRYKGANACRINAEKGLLAETQLGKILEEAPVSYQMINGNKVPVSSNFINQNNQISFSTGTYQKNLPLIIDPSILVWGTYYGGPGISNDNSADLSQHLVLDANGDLVMVGQTNSSSFPTSPGSVQSVSGGGKDGFVVKFSPTGTRLWGTYYGGIGEDEIRSCASDKSNNIFFTGVTRSTNLAVLNPGGGAFFNGVNTATTAQNPLNVTAFIGKLNTSGSITWSTYFGGDVGQGGLDVFVDASDNLLITGYTGSSETKNFPLKNADQAIYGGPSSGTFFGDIFVGKFSNSGIQQWTTYLGGPVNELGYGIASDSIGNVYISGEAEGSGIVHKSAYQANFAGGSKDVVLAKYDKDGKRIWSTYYGGSGLDLSRDIIIHKNAAYITGVTSSNSSAGTTDLPGPSTGVVQPNHAGGTGDGFLLKFNLDASANQVLWRSYNGGSGDDGEDEIVVNNSGNILIGGYTNSSNFPTFPNSYQTIIGGGYDGHVVTLNDKGQRVCATFFGGKFRDNVYGMAVASNGDVFITGNTGNRTSDGFNTTNNAFQSEKSGSSGDNILDSYLARISEIPDKPKASFTATPNSGCSTPLKVKITNSSTFNNTCYWLTTWDWSFPGADITSSKDQNPPDITYNTPGEYTIKLTVTNFGGTDFFEQKIIINNKLKINAGPDVTICNGESATLTASGADTYSWTPVDGLQNSTSATVTAKPVYTTDYVVNGTKTGCSLIPDTIRVNVLDKLTLTVTPNQSICAGDSVKLIAKGADTYLWIPSTGLNSTTSDTVWAKPTFSTTYVVSGKKASCAITPASVKVTLDSIDTKIEATILNEAQVPFDLKASNKSVNGQVCTWKLKLKNGSEQTFDNQTDLTTTINQSGDYTLKLICKNNTGCEDVDSISFTLKEGIVSLIIPNVFSPGASDTLNNKFKFQMSGIKELNGIIYNRWGKEVYSWTGTDKEKFWDGTIDGADAPDGIYFYVIEATDFQGKKVTANTPDNQPLPDPIRGTVTLIRGK